LAFGRAAAQGSDKITQMWTKKARQNGGAIDEIIEAMNVAPYMKQATVNDTMANSLKILLEDK